MLPAGMAPHATAAAAGAARRRLLTPTSPPTTFARRHARALRNSLQRQTGSPHANHPPAACALSLLPCRCLLRLLCRCASDPHSPQPSLLPLQVCLVGSRQFNTFGAHGSSEFVDFCHYGTLEECCRDLRENKGGWVAGWAGGGGGGREQRPVEGGQGCGLQCPVPIKWPQMGASHSQHAVVAQCLPPPPYPHPPHAACTRRACCRVLDSGG